MVPAVCNILDIHFVVVVMVVVVTVFRVGDDSNSVDGR